MLDQLHPDQIAQLGYLGILAVVLVSYALVAMRGRIGTALRSLVLWALLITGTAAAYGLWESARFSIAATQVGDGQSITLRRGFDGHFQAVLTITGANGTPTPIRFIVDTGATEMVLTRADAAKLGYPDSALNFLGTARTANGVTRTAQVRLPQVELEGHVSTRVRALVNEGELHSSLLGMGYLERFARIEIAGDTLRIVY